MLFGMCRQYGAIRRYHQQISQNSKANEIFEWKKLDIKNNKNENNTP